MSLRASEAVAVLERMSLVLQAKVEEVEYRRCCRAEVAEEGVFLQSLLQVLAEVVVCHWMLLGLQAKVEEVECWCSSQPNLNLIVAEEEEFLLLLIQTE